MEAATLPVQLKKLEETANTEVNTSVSEMGYFDFMDSESESIPFPCPSLLRLTSPYPTWPYACFINVERGRFVAWTA